MQAGTRDALSCTDRYQPTGPHGHVSGPLVKFDMGHYPQGAMTSLVPIGYLDRIRDRACKQRVIVTPAKSPSHPVTPCHTMSHHITPCHTLSHPVTPTHTQSHPVTLCHTQSHPVTPSHTLSHPVTPSPPSPPSHTLSHPVTPSHTLSHFLSQSHSLTLNIISKEDTYYLLPEN